MKHTPGPWRVGEMRGQYIDVNHCNNHQNGAISLTLAKVTARPTWLSESEANARFIAAAPDLLEALKTVTAFVQPSLHVRNAEAMDALDRARAAIAKAEGA